MKLGFDTGEAGKLLFKASRTEQTSNETYLGLTDADFNANPNRRYGLSTIDQMTNKHEGYNLTYSHEIDDSKISQLQRIKIITSGIGLRLLREGTT